HIVGEPSMCISMRLRLLATALFFVSTGVVAVEAASTPTVDYTATQVIDSEPRFVSKVYVAEGKKRTETIKGGQQIIAIIRPDKKLGWLLRPADKTYQEVEFRGARHASVAEFFGKAELIESGQETIDGIKA